MWPKGRRSRPPGWFHVVAVVLTLGLGLLRVFLPPMSIPASRRQGRLGRPGFLMRKRGNL
jgi:hypothetical protein